MAEELSYGNDLWDKISIVKDMVNQNKKTLEAWKEFIQSFNSALMTFEEHMQISSQTLLKSINPLSLTDESEGYSQSIQLARAFTSMTLDISRSLREMCEDRIRPNVYQPLAEYHDSYCNQSYRILSEYYGIWDQL